MLLKRPPSRIIKISLQSPLKTVYDEVIVKNGHNVTSKVNTKVTSKTVNSTPVIKTGNGAEVPVEKASA